MIATGAGANSRRAIGTTVFSGMLLATVLGIFLIPALYAAFQRMREKLKTLSKGASQGDEEGNNPTTDGETNHS